MKRLIIFLILPYLFIPHNIEAETVYAKAETSTYAKATANCTLYKTQSMNNDVTNIYFIVPETYFVIILDKVSEECYKVQYDKFIGYVDTSTIIVATFIPIVKTLDDITLDIKDTSGTQIWNQPNTSGKILSTISAGFKNIEYIASCYGSIPSGGESNLWFYVNYTPSENSTNVYEGYIYSENTTNLSEIVANTESNPEIINDTNSAEDILYFSSSLKTIIIIIITVPIIIFLLIILYKLSKKFKNITINHKNKNSNSNSQVFENDQESNFIYDPPSSAQNMPKNNQTCLKDNLSKMRDLTYLKKQNRSYPEFPDYNLDDDIL